MPEVSSINLASLLRTHMAKHGISHKEMAQKVELSTLTISYFLRGITSPHGSTREKIEDYLKNEGVLTRFGFPTEVPSFVEPPLETADDVETVDDAEQLKQMGFRQTPSSFALTKQEERFLIYAIYHAHGLQEQKDALLDRLLGQ